MVVFCESLDFSQLIDLFFPFLTKGINLKASGNVIEETSGCFMVKFPTWFIFPFYLTQVGLKVLCSFYYRGCYWGMIYGIWYGQEWFSSLLKTEKDFSPAFLRKKKNSKTGKLSLLFFPFHAFKKLFSQHNVNMLNNSRLFLFISKMEFTFSKSRLRWFNLNKGCKLIVINAVFNMKMYWQCYIIKLLKPYDKALWVKI